MLPSDLSLRGGELKTLVITAKISQKKWKGLPQNEVRNPNLLTEISWGLFETENKTSRFSRNQKCSQKWSVDQKLSMQSKILLRKKYLFLVTAPVLLLVLSFYFPKWKFNSNHTFA